MSVPYTVRTYAHTIWDWPTRLYIPFTAQSQQAVLILWCVEDEGLTIMAVAGHTAGMEFRFTGTVDLEILAATDLKPITITGGRTLGIFDPFVVVDFDEIFFCQTIAKAKTLSPTWREHFTEDVQDAESVTFTLFHKAVVPPDPFIGHIRIQLDELFTAGKEQFEVRQQQLLCAFLHKSTPSVCFRS